jgi:uncharacterized membrane protein YhhN
MIYIVIIACLSLIFAIISAFFHNGQKHKEKIFFKSAASALFCAGGGVALLLNPSNRLAIWLMVFFVFALLGDIFLSLSPVTAAEAKKTFFNVFGGVCFGIGHIILITYFALLAPVSPLCLLLAPVFPLAVFALKAAKQIDAGKLFIPVLFYALMLGVTASLALSVMINARNIGGALIFWGALAFGLSDVLLLILNFGSQSVKRRSAVYFYILMVLYYAAQSLFALSVLF